MIICYFNVLTMRGLILYIKLFCQAKMVYFICDVCQETLKKNKVDQHLKVCKDCNGVSCVDCGKFFPGTSYSQHSVCITEAEKYQGALFQKKNGKEKVNPQEVWMNKIKELAQSCADPTLKKIFVKLAGYDNVPRKQKSFINFVQNSCHFPKDQVDKVWKTLEELKTNIQQERENEKATKRKATESSEEKVENTAKKAKIEKEEKINWNELIMKNLTKDPIEPKKLFKMIYKTLPKSDENSDKKKLKNEFDEAVESNEAIKKDVIIHL